TGAPPYGDSNPTVVITRHVNAPPPSISTNRPELAGLDAVFATALAKEPSARFGSCAEFAYQLGQRVGPGFAYAGAIPPTGNTHAARPAIEVVPPISPFWKRPRVLVGALVGVALLIAGGVLAAVKLTRHQHPATVTNPTPATATAAATPNTGPFTGVYRVDM